MVQRGTPTAPISILQGTVGYVKVLLTGICTQFGAKSGGNKELRDLGSTMNLIKEKIARTCSYTP